MGSHIWWGHLERPADITGGQAVVDHQVPSRLGRKWSPTGIVCISLVKESVGEKPLLVELGGWYPKKLQKDLLRKIISFKI